MQISDAESVVMQALWRRSPRSAEAVVAESESLLDRLFGGRVAPMVAHFTERGRLSKRDLAELRKLLENVDDGK